MSLHKVSQILDLFTTHIPEWGVTEIAHSLNLPKATTHRLLLDMSRAGFLHRLNNRRYRLSLRYLSLAEVAKYSTPWREVLTQQLLYVQEQVQESVFWAVLEGEHVLYVQSWRLPEAVNLPASGARLIAEQDPLGNVLLAGLDEAERKKLLLSTSHPRAFLDIAEQGFCEIQHWHDQFSGYAVPLLSRNGEVIAALALLGLPERFVKYHNQWLKALQHASYYTSQRIGYDPELLHDNHKWQSIAGKDELKPLKMPKK